MKRFASVLLAVALVGGVAAYIHQPSPSRRVGAHLPEPAPSATSELAAPLAAIESAAYATRDARLAQARAQAPSSAAPADTEAQAAQRLQTTFERMKAVRGLIIADRERKKLADEVLADPAAMASVRAVLEKPEEARRLFGEGQAEARHYAVEIVREAARRGRPELAMELASTIARELGANAGVEKGRALDLEGVMSAYAEGLGTDRHGAIDRIRHELRQLGDPSGLAPEVGRAIARGLFDGFWRTSDSETAQRLVNELLAS